MSSDHKIMLGSVGGELDVQSPNHHEYVDGFEYTREKSGAIAKFLGYNRHSSSGYNFPGLSEPGDQLRCAPGTYKGFRITHSYKPGELAKLVMGPAQTPINVFPSHEYSDKTIYAEWQGPMILANMNVYAGKTAAFMTENYKADRFNGKHPGNSWILMDNVNLFAQPSVRAKWFMLTYGLGRNPEPGRWGFSWQNSMAQGLLPLDDRENPKEHVLYDHGVDGISDTAKALRMKNIEAKHFGRTFLQLRPKPGEGYDEPGESRGQVLVEGCYVEDGGLQDGGGGSMITVKGNHVGNVTVRNTVIRLGGISSLPEPYQKEITGCVVTELEEDSGRGLDGTLSLESCGFYVGEVYPGQGSARRPSINIAHVDVFEMVDCKAMNFEGTREVLRFRDTHTIGKVVLDNNPSDILGAVYWDGIKFNTYQEFIDFARDHLQAKVVLSPQIYALG